MHGMGAAPEIVRRQRQHADDAADPVVAPFAPEEGAVAAVVLDHEQPHQEAGRRHRDQERRPPVAEPADEPGCGPERGERQRRDDQFDHAAGAARFAIAGENLGPGAGVGGVGVRRVSDRGDAQWLWSRLTATA